MNGIRKKYTISEIKQINADNGGHYFERSTMRFFRSKAERTVYSGPGGVYFITSEQFVPSEGPAHARKYTVRAFNPESGNISTFGEFNQLSLEGARLLARRAARTPPAPSSGFTDPRGYRGEVSVGQVA